MAKEALGVDCGGVIIGRSCKISLYPPKVSPWSPFPHAFEVLKELKEKRFGDNIFVVSHVYFLGQTTISFWLWRHGFCKDSGISKDRIHFCRKRSDKVDICIRLGITHFIDDHSEVLEYLHEAGVSNLYLFEGRPKEMAPRLNILEHVRRVESWLQIRRELLG